MRILLTYNMKTARISTVQNPKIIVVVYKGAGPVLYIELSNSIQIFRF